MTTLFTLIGLFLGIVLSAVSIYKRIERLRSALRQAWSEVDLQLGKRYEAANQLVQAAAGCPGMDASALEKISPALSDAMQAASPKEKTAAEHRFRYALQAGFMRSESCSNPETRNILDHLRSRVKEIERDLEVAVEYYNALVRDYNATISYFPSNLIASRFHFEPEDSFQLDKMSSEVKGMEKETV